MVISRFHSEFRAVYQVHEDYMGSFIISTTRPQANVE